MRGFIAFDMRFIALYIDYTALYINSFVMVILEHNSSLLQVVCFPFATDNFN